MRKGQPPFVILFIPPIAFLSASLRLIKYESDLKKQALEQYFPLDTFLFNQEGLMRNSFLQTKQFVLTSPPFHREFFAPIFNLAEQVIEQYLNLPSLISEGVL